MNRDQIRETLQEILETETSRRIEALSDDSRIVEDFGLDSVDIVSLMMHVEQHFRVRMSHEELAAVSTVGTLVDLICEKTGGQAVVSGSR
jgi:acyl carrier protein